jgi:hypothetical protein
MISLQEAKQYIILWRKHGASFDVVGGIWKKKKVLHDIDLVVRPGNVEKVSKIILSNKPNVPVELYIPLKERERLIKTLRSSTWENIHGRLMKNLRFTKVRL